jgi:predicted DNA-binding transcriptional regulator AlpA
MNNIRIERLTSGWEASNLPPTIDIRGLSKLLHKSVRTTYRLLKEHPEMPEWRKIGGTRIWVTGAVLKWLSPQQPIQDSFSLAQQLIKAGAAGKEKK